MGQSQSYDLTDSGKGKAGKGKENVDEVRQTGGRWRDEDARDHIIYAYENKPKEPPKASPSSQGEIEVIRHEEMHQTLLHIEPHAYSDAENDPGFTREVKVDEEASERREQNRTEEPNKDEEIYVLRKADTLATIPLNSSAKPSTSYYD